VKNKSERPFAQALSFKGFSSARDSTRGSLLTRCSSPACEIHDRFQTGGSITRRSQPRSAGNIALTRYTRQRLLPTGGFFASDDIADLYVGAPASRLAGAMCCAAGPVMGRRIVGIVPPCPADRREPSHRPAGCVEAWRTSSAM
jgi:hypothetical protein